MSREEKLPPLPERDAFEKWFNEVEVGDGEIPLPTPADRKRWDEYVARHGLAFAAWKAAREQALEEAASVLDVQDVDPAFKGRMACAIRALKGQA
jgi:hypothetical protein